MKEIIARFLAEKPKFFRVVQTIGFVLAVTCFVPQIIETAGIEVPETITKILNTYVGIAGAVAALIAQFTVNTPRATKQVLSKIDRGENAHIASKGV